MKHLVFGIELHPFWGKYIMNTKSSQQLAYELARNLVTVLYGYSVFIETNKGDVDRISKEILENLPLLELLEVARAAKEHVDKYGYIKDLHNSAPSKGTCNHLADALTNLQKKVEL